MVSRFLISPPRLMMVVWLALSDQPPVAAD
jgi:hypothetical protein